jgi:hypothetical protein
MILREPEIADSVTYNRLIGGNGGIGSDSAVRFDEPHASSTLTSRHPRRQSTRSIVKVAQQGDRARKERMAAAGKLHRNRLAIFWKSVLEKFRMGSGANRHRRPRDVLRMVAGQMVKVVRATRARCPMLGA